MVGTVPEGASEDDWMEGLPCAIAWDTVQDYVVFDSMTDYLARLRLNRRRTKGTAKTVQPRPVSRFAKKRDGAASA